MGTGKDTFVKAQQKTETLRILIAEDEILIGMFLAEFLEEMGHQICGIETTEANLVAAADQYRPDLMIVDARLDQGDGVSAVEKILQSGFVPHLFISGDLSGVLARRSDAIVIQKPFRELDLIQGIQRALKAPAVI
jgi:DNA-binding response OmpR family regulator